MKKKNEKQADPILDALVARVRELNPSWGRYRSYYGEHFSTEEIAKACGVCRTAMHRILHGTRWPSKRVLYALVETLGLEIVLKLKTKTAGKGDKKSQTAGGR